MDKVRKKKKKLPELCYKPATLQLISLSHTHNFLFLHSSFPSLFITVCYAIVNKG
jgi:hypothetical protein